MTFTTMRGARAPRARYSVEAVAALVALVALVRSAPAEAACSGRPTDPAGFQGYRYGAGEVRSHATPRARVHWAISGSHAPNTASTRGDGVPDIVAFAADVAEDSLTRYAAMGFRPVPSDGACAANGGDDKLDLYLVHFTAADGATVPECVGASCSSFVLVASTFERGYANAEEGFRTVIAHELFHAVQNAYRPQPEPFWAEGTAQWAMKTLFPELQDFERHLAPFFSDPTRSIDAAPAGVTAGFLYGSAVWPLFLSSKHGPSVIREILEREAEGDELLAATDAVLRTKGSSLSDAYPLFAAWNAATGRLPSSGGYPNAATYPGTAVLELTDGAGAITSGFGYFAYRGTVGASSIVLETDTTRNGGIVVPIEAGTAMLEKAQKLPANVEGDVLVVVAGTTTKKSDAPFTLRIGPPSRAESGASRDDGCHAAPHGAAGGDGRRHAAVGASMASGLALFVRRGRKRARRAAETRS